MEFLQLSFSKYNWLKCFDIHNELIVLLALQGCSENFPEKGRKKAYSLKHDVYFHVTSMVWLNISINNSVYGWFQHVFSS